MQEVTKESIEINLGQLLDQSSSILEDIRPAKKKAFDKFLEVGFPTNKQEEYKFTPFNKIVDKHFDFGSFNSSSKVEESDVYQQLNGSKQIGLLVFVNGTLNERLSVLPSAEGVQIEKLSAGNFSSVAKLVEREEANTDPFYQLNTASFSDGTVMTVKKNKAFDNDQPLIILNVSDADASGFSFERNFILAEENSQISIVEYRLNLSSSKFLSNNVTQVTVQKSAIVNYYKVQDDHKETYHVENHLAYQQANGFFNHYTFDFKGGVIRNNLLITLDDEHTEAHMYGLYLLNSSTQVDNHTTVDHRKANCFSNELYRGVMDEKSNGVFNGKIYVRPNAQKTNAFQANNNIVLSDTASVNTKPQLEIWADDVKCSHGCTTGQLDEDAIFYLQARGVSKHTAKAMLLNSFASEVIEKVKTDWLKEILVEKVTERLGKF